jgi:hypothetical protein
MLFPFAIDQAEHLGASGVESVGVDIDAIDGVGKRGKPETSCEPLRKIVGAKVEAQAGSDEMKVEAGVADGGDTIAKIVEGARFQGKRDGDFQAFAEIEAVEGFLASELGELGDEVAENPAEVGAQGRDGGVVADVQGGELFGKGVATGLGESPLREVIREAFGEEVVRAESLKGVVEDRGVTATLETGEEFLKISGGLVADAGEVRDGEKFEGSFGGVHERVSGSRFGAGAFVGLSWQILNGSTAWGPESQALTQLFGTTEVVRS